MYADDKQAGPSCAAVLGGRLGARTLLPLLLLGAALATAGCGNTRGGNIPYQVQLAQPDAPEAATLAEDYRIAPLDTLRIAVFQVPDLSGEYSVDLMGNVSLPLLGNVKAVSLTPTELDQQLTQRLGEKYLQSPDVSVGVKSSSTRVITVDGAVNSPGVIAAPQPMTLMQVIAVAKGTSQDSNPRRIAVFRQIQGQRMAAAFDLTTIRRGESEDPKIYAGDVVVVDGGSKMNKIYQQVMGSIPLLTVFRPF